MKIFCKVQNEFDHFGVFKYALDFSIFFYFSNVELKISKPRNNLQTPRKILKSPKHLSLEKQLPLYCVVNSMENSEMSKKFENSKSVILCSSFEIFLGSFISHLKSPKLQDKCNFPITCNI